MKRNLNRRIQIIVRMKVRVRLKSSSMKSGHLISPSRQITNSKFIQIIRITKTNNFNKKKKKLFKKKKKKAHTMVVNTKVKPIK